MQPVGADRIFDMGCEARGEFGLASVEAHVSDDPLINQLQDALAATPGNVALRLVLAGRMKEVGANGELVALLEEVEPGSFQIDQITQAGAMLFDIGESERALNLLRAHLDRGRSHGEFQYLLARCQAAAGETDEGRRSWLKARELMPALEDESLNVKLQPSEIGTASRRPVPPLRVLDGGSQKVETTIPLESETRVVRFSDVGGYDEIKKIIRRKIILPFKRPELFKKYGREAGGGILLYGAPGCGKTHMARATAGEVGAEFINVGIEDVLDLWMGESERKLHSIFEQARAKAPSVLFFDEIEALGGKRSQTQNVSWGALISQFLSEMDGFDKVNHQVLIIGATNVPWSIDPAFRRPGRFDDVIFVPPPDREARASILDIMLRDRPAEGIDVNLLVTRTKGFSGADLKYLIESGFDQVIDEALDTGGEPAMTMRHLAQPLDKIKPTTVEWLSTARNYATYSNESGQYDEVLEFLKSHKK